MSKLPDIVCVRTPPGRMTPGAKCRVNIPQEVVQHSPDGFEWGYGGSGPADLALNVLHLFIPPGTDQEESVPLFRGECSQTAWLLHQDFKREFIATLPEEGGTIFATEVIAWLKERVQDYVHPL